MKKTKREKLTMVSHTTWIVFAHLVLFDPQGNGNENELASWHQNEFHSLGQCNDFLQQNYVMIDTTLQRHAKRRNARVIIVGCGDKEKLAKTKLQYEMYHKRGTDT